MENPKQFRKIPTVIEAIEFTGKNYDAIHKFCPVIIYNLKDTKTPVIPTLEGKMIVSKGDFIIKGIKGEFYPCKPDIFKKTYTEEM